jgi:glycosyltransferase involved in cell wall biosynthesis
MTKAPEVSFVIPVFNEEAILRAAVVDLRERLAPHALSYEVVLAENGSRDATAQAALELHARYPEVRLVQSPTPNYGQALRLGIQSARGTFVICEEIDLCDVDFHLQALALLRENRAELVIGSKLLGGARDERPLLRHAASQLYTAVLRVLFDFRGSDTHGLKAFRRSALLPLVESCRVEGDVFASELVIRAYREPLRVLEIPVRVLEKRPPSINLLRRVPRVLRDLAHLTRSIGMRP